MYSREKGEKNNVPIITDAGDKIEQSVFYSIRLHLGMMMDIHVHRSTYSWFSLKCTNRYVGRCMHEGTVENLETQIDKSIGSSSVDEQY